MPEVQIKKSADDDMGLVSSDSHYPYGTTLEFEGDLLEELDIFEKVEIGQSIKITGTMTVTRRSDNEYLSDEKSEVETRRCLGLQLTSVSLSVEGKQKSRSEVLYKE